MFVQGIGIGESTVRLTAEEFRLLAEVCHTSEVGVLDGRDNEVIALATTFSVLAVIGFGSGMMMLKDWTELEERMRDIPFNGMWFPSCSKRGPVTFHCLPTRKMSVVDRMCKEKRHKQARQWRGLGRKKR